MNNITGFLFHIAVVFFIGVAITVFFFQLSAVENIYDTVRKRSVDQIGVFHSKMDVNSSVQGEEIFLSIINGLEYSIQIHGVEISPNSPLEEMDLTRLDFDEYYKKEIIFDEKNQIEKIIYELE